MKKLFIILALFAASGAMESQAQNRRQVVWYPSDNDYYRDGRGSYRWEMRPRRVWIPEHYVGGIFGIGSRRVPGRYEVRYDRVKVYSNNRSYRKGHPHGMPPGQRKKMYNKHRDRDRDWNYHRGRRDD